MVSRNLGNVTGIVVLQLVDVPDDLSFVRADGGKEQKVLQVLVVAERRFLNDDLLQ